MSDLPSITCPLCSRTSYNQNDVQHRYCGACREFHDAMKDAIRERLHNRVLGWFDKFDITERRIAFGDWKQSECNLLALHIEIESAIKDVQALQKL